MSINIATSGVTNIYIGTSGASAVYLGNDLVWGIGGKDYSKEYFTIEMLSAGTISWAANGVYYSVNDSEWNEWDSGSSLSVSAEDKVRYKSDVNTSYNNISFNITNYCKVYGNIMSLVYGDNFSGQTSLANMGDNTFRSLFQSNSYKLKDIENLVLPATTLAPACYNSMFYSCGMLEGNLPQLPATTLTNGCYGLMFFGCNKITKSPDLPATTLAEDCYSSMFAGCTSLTTAPELPATTLAKGCYARMFNGCTSLNYVKCLAKNLYNKYTTSNWLQGVSATGTFVKDATMNDWTTGASGIPDNWTIENV